MLKKERFTCALLQIFRIVVSKAPLKLPPPSNFKVFATFLERVTSQWKKMSPCFLTWNLTKLRWRDLRSQLCFSLLLSGKKTNISENTEFFLHSFFFGTIAALLRPCPRKKTALLPPRLLSLLTIHKLYVFQWGQKTFLGVSKQKWQRVLIHKFFALSGLQNCNRTLSAIQIFFRAEIKTKYLLFA